MTSPNQRKKVVIKKPKRLVTVKKDAPKKLPDPPLPTAASQSPTALSQKVEDAQVFDFFCPYCGQRIPTRRDRVGSRITCSVCGHGISVPEPLADGGAEVKGGGPAAEERDEVFRFFCIGCGQKLSAPRKMVGRKTICPTCHNHLEIPEPPQTPAKPRESQPIGQDEVFKFFCLWCGMKLSAINKWAGSEICCPGCKTPISIPNSPEQKPEGG